MAGKLGMLALVTYAAVTTGLLTSTVVLGDATEDRQFNEITVHRINVVEPDGTLRMVIANHDALPRDAVGNREGTNEREGGGIIFYNDEGRENGGLIFAGHRDADGRIIDSGGSLSFDKYGASGNALQLAAVSDSMNQFAGLAIRDIGVGTPNADRIWVGNTDDGNATLALMDARGRKRIVMEVTADGAPSLTFLDEDGAVLDQLTPASPPQ